MSRFLSYGRQSIDEADLEAVTGVLRSDWLTQGPLVEGFEFKLAETTGSEHAVVCANGTAALHLAVMAAGLGPGDAAVVPAVTFVATANAVRMTGAEIVFADVDPLTGRITGETLKAALAVDRGDATAKAVLPVHLAGAASSMDEISGVAEDNAIAVIEDACHALGGSYRHRERTVRAGSCTGSLMACFSFHPVKPITTAEGGAVTTNESGLADQMRKLRSHGVARVSSEYKNRSQAFAANGEPNPWYYEMREIGWNYRLSDIHCALGLSQLDRLAAFRAHREKLVLHYREHLKRLAPIVLTSPEVEGVISSHHLFVVLIDFEGAGITRARVMRSLEDRGIGTQVHYIPVPWQPYYFERYGEGDYPGAAAYYAKCLSLPLFIGMNHEDVERVVDTLSDILGL